MCTLRGVGGGGGCDSQVLLVITMVANYITTRCLTEAQLFMQILFFHICGIPSVFVFSNTICKSKFEH